MSLVYQDRVKQNISATGTGALNLLVAIASYNTFEGANLGSNVFPYVITNATQYEVGLGSYTTISQSGTSNGILNRISVLSNSNGDNNFVNFNGNPATAAITNAAELSVLTSTQPTANTIKLIKWFNSQYVLIDPIHNSPSLGTSINNSVMFFNSITTEYQADPNFQYFPNGLPEVQVNGVLSASAKCFVIKHPIKPDTILRNGCLEGPEYGIYIRGSVLTHHKAEIIFPDYFKELINKCTYGVQITTNSFMPIKTIKYVNKVVIKSLLPTIKPIEIDYFITASRKDIPFILEE
jgi:hypothetical protein